MEKFIASSDDIATSVSNYFASLADEMRSWQSDAAAMTMALEEDNELAFMLEEASPTLEVSDDPVLSDLIR